MKKLMVNNTQSLQQQFANIVMDFVHVSLCEMQAKAPIDNARLRIAIPTLFTTWLYQGLCEIGTHTAYGTGYHPDNPTLNMIMGIKCHPTWEMSITLYHIDCILYGTDTYKLSFEQIKQVMPQYVKHPDLVNKKGIVVDQSYRYKL